MSIDIFERLENRQFNGYQIKKALRDSNFIKGLPREYVSGAGITKDDMIEKLDKFLNCGSIVEVQQYKSGKNIVRNANYCGLLGCWTCGAKTEKRRYMRLREKILNAAKIYPYAYHVTFTIKDGEDVKERSLFLRKSLTRFRKLGQAGRSGEYSRVRAGIFSQEIIEGKYSKMYHTHAHAILWSDQQLDFSVYNWKSEEAKALKEKYGYGNIPKDELKKIAKFYYIDIDGKEQPASPLSSQWHTATQGQGSSINARLIESEKDYTKALEEVIKYATKMNENAPGRVAEIMAECHGMRFFSTVKKMRFDRKNGEAPPEPEPITEEAAETIRIRWNTKIQKYEQWQGQTAIQADQQDEKRKEYLAKAAVVLAAYRSERNSIIKNPPKNIELYLILDNLKAAMRKKIKHIWSSFERLSWTPRKTDFILKTLREAKNDYRNLVYNDFYGTSTA